MSSFNRGKHRAECLSKVVTVEDNVKLLDEFHFIISCDDLGGSDSPRG